MDAKTLVEIVTEYNELKKELYAAKLDKLTSVDEDLLELLKRVARHEDEVFEDLQKLAKEEA